MSKEIRLLALAVAIYTSGYITNDIVTEIGDALRPLQMASHSRGSSSEWNGGFDVDQWYSASIPYSPYGSSAQSTVSVSRSYSTADIGAYVHLQYGPCDEDPEKGITCSYKKSRSAPGR
jgi:hypothetical protein